MAELGVGGGADDADPEHRQGAARHSFDDADAAPGQSRVHAQYPHEAPPLPIGQLFPQAIGSH
ncbi:hypothetical protein GCM10018966_038380 [Streptomyces yanii]